MGQCNWPILPQKPPWPDRLDATTSSRSRSRIHDHDKKQLGVQSNGYWMRSNIRRNNSIDRIEARNLTGFTRNGKDTKSTYETHITRPQTSNWISSRKAVNAGYPCIFSCPWKKSWSWLCAFLRGLSRELECMIMITNKWVSNRMAIEWGIPTFAETTRLIELKLEI